MKRYAILFSILCLIASACTQPKEVEQEPAILKIDPVALAGEGWRSHDISFTVVCDKDVTVTLKDCSWATITSTEVSGSGRTSVVVHLEDNLGDEPRTARIEALSVTTTFEAEFTQKALGSALGAWNYDGRGGEIPYDELSCQLSVRRYPDGRVDSRQMDVVNGKFLVFKGIPKSATVGSTITLTVLQNYMRTSPLLREATMEVIRIGDGKIWLAEDNAIYIMRI